MMLASWLIPLDGGLKCDYSWIWSLEKSRTYILVVDADQNTISALAFKTFWKIDYPSKPLGLFKPDEGKCTSYFYGIISLKKCASGQSGIPIKPHFSKKGLTMPAFIETILMVLVNVWTLTHLYAQSNGYSLIMPWPGSHSQRGVDPAVRIPLVHLIAPESQTWCLKQSQLQHL